jgi:hypothetical protein
VVQNPGSAWALWHRAYARALAGMYAAALSDLAQAVQVQNAIRDGGPPPGWVRVIEMHCQYDVKGLYAVAAKEQALAPLATFLAVLNVAARERSAEVYEKGKVALAVNDENYYLIDRICQDAELGVKHHLTVAGPQTLAQKTLRQTLLTVAGLPKEVTASIEALGQGAGRDGPAAAQAGAGESDRVAAVWQTLVRQGSDDKDRGEPSWAALGRLIEDTHFLQTWRRAAFMRDLWAVDIESCQQYVKDAIRLIGKDHPFRSLIEHYGVSRRRDPARYDMLAADVHVADPALPMWNWVALARQSRPKAEQAANDQVARIVDSRDFLARSMPTTHTESSCCAN